MKRDIKLNYEVPLISGIEVELEQVIAASNNIPMEDGGFVQDSWVENDISTGDIELQ